MEMETAQDKQDALVEAWSNVIEGDWNTFDEVFADDVRYEDPSTELHGREAIKDYIETWLDAFPDFEAEFLDVVANDDIVMSSFSTRGTHEGEFQGIPATGNSFEGIAMSLDRFENNHVVEEINIWDNLTLLQQLEIDPSEL